MCTVPHGAEPKTLRDRLMPRKAAWLVAANFRLDAGGSTEAGSDHGTDG
jgi:hypothetical protein